MARLDWYIRANLKPRHLQLLVALDELRNLGKVAASLNITQPAVSLALSELEKGLGFKLFDRTARGVQPNAYGECLIRQARVMLNTLAQTRDELRALLSGASGRTALGAMPAMTSALVPQALAALKRVSPTTTVHVQEGSMDTLLPQLRRGHLDVLVGRLSSWPSADFEEAPLFEGSSMVVVGRQHPLAGVSSLHWRDETPAKGCWRRWRPCPGNPWRPSSRNTTLPCPATTSKPCRFRSSPTISSPPGPSASCPASRPATTATWACWPFCPWNSPACCAPSA